MANEDGRRKDRGKTLPGYYVEWYDYGHDGKRCHRTRRFERMVDARRFLRRFNARWDLDIGDVVQVTITEALEEFLSGLSGVTAAWRREYETVIARFAGFTNDCIVAEVDGRAMDRFVASELSDRGPGRSRSTIAKHLQIISRFFNWAVKRGYATANPVKDSTSRPRSEARARPVVSEADIERLIAAIDTEDRKVAVWIAITTGFDRGVIQRLTPPQVDLENECFVVVRPKTRQRLRVPIHRALIDVLRRKLASPPATGLLLSGLHRQDRVKHVDWWHEACRKAGLADLWFRDLRAVASMRLQRAGASLADAQNLLGHRSPSTTATYYHIPDQKIAERIHSAPLPGFPSDAAATKP